MFPDIQWGAPEVVMVSHVIAKQNMGSNLKHFKSEWLISNWRRVETDTQPGRILTVPIHKDQKRRWLKELARCIWTPETLIGLHRGSHDFWGGNICAFRTSHPPVGSLCLLGNFSTLCQVPVASQAGLETTLTLVTLEHIKSLNICRAVIICNIGKLRPKGEEGFVPRRLPFRGGIKVEPRSPLRVVRPWAGTSSRGKSHILYCLLKTSMWVGLRVRVSWNKHSHPPTVEPGSEQTLWSLQSHKGSLTAVSVPCTRVVEASSEPHSDEKN